MVMVRLPLHAVEHSTREIEYSFNDFSIQAANFSPICLYGLLLPDTCIFLKWQLELSKLKVRV